LFKMVMNDLPESMNRYKFIAMIYL